MRSFSTSPDALRLRGTCYYHTNNAAQAIKHLQQALEYDPDNEKSRRLLKAIKKVEALKQQGNDAFKAGQNQEVCSGKGGDRGG